MDPVTHALSGAVCIQCLPPETRSRWMVAWGALVAASPDIDVIFCRTPVQYIEWHRGLSHSFLGMIPLALLCAWLLLRVLALEKPRADASAARHGWTLPLAFGLSYGLLLLHVWFDVVTSYGTQIFLPFSTYRARLSSLFIVDAPLVLFMAAGLVFFASRRRVMVALLAFVLLYPAASWGGRLHLEHRFAALLPQTIDGRTVQGMELTTDAFAPFLWKMIVDTDDAYLVATNVTPFSSVPSTFETYPKPLASLWEQLQRQHRFFSSYARFAQFPYLESTQQLATLPPELAHAPELAGIRGPFTVDVYTDLRFGSGLEFMRRIQGTDDKEREKTFRITALTDAEGHLVAVRFRVVRGAGGDSGWVPVSRGL